MSPCHLVIFCLLVGCHRPADTDLRSAQIQEKAAPAYRIVKPERKTILNRIEQPGFNIEAFQEDAPVRPDQRLRQGMEGRSG